MKLNRLVIVSVVLNCSLLGAFGYLYVTRPTSGAATVTTNVVSKVVLRLATNKAPASAALVTHAPEEKFSWRSVESAEYKTYIANLRAVECPEETIRDIIVSDVNKLYAEKMRALRGQGNENKYWKSYNWASKEELERQKKLRALEKEKTELLKELLGVDPNKEAQRELGFVDYWERMYSFLPEEKRAKAREVQDKYQELQQGFYRRGPVDEEDQKELRKLRKQQMAEMAQFLTPQELEDYDLRTAQTANQLRYDLDGFEPSEKEFREIFKLRQAREEDLASVYDPEDKAAQAKRNKAVQETDQQLKQLLGEDRFAEYKRAQDYEYKNLARLADRQGLPKEAAVTVYDMKKTVEDQAAKVRNNQSLAPEQRNEALKAIKAETEKSITETLGDRGYKSYRGRSGWWIDSLVPRTPIPRPASTPKP